MRPFLSLVPLALLAACAPKPPGPVPAKPDEKPKPVVGAWRHVGKPYVLLVFLQDGRGVRVHDEQSIYAFRWRMPRPNRLIVDLPGGQEGAMEEIVPMTLSPDGKTMSFGTDLSFSFERQRRYRRLDTYVQYPGKIVRRWNPMTRETTAASEPFAVEAAPPPSVK